MTAIKLLYLNHTIKPFFSTKFLGKEAYQRLTGIVYIGVLPLQIYISWAAEFEVKQKLRHIDITMWVEGVISERHRFHLRILLSEIRKELEAAINSGFLRPSLLMNSYSYGVRKTGFRCFSIFCGNP